MKQIDCPYCNGIANLEIQEKYYFYKCNLCSEEFTTSIVDQLTIDNLSK